jgi:hypothetical protein
MRFKKKEVGFTIVSDITAYSLEDVKSVLKGWGKNRDKIDIISFNNIAINNNIGRRESHDFENLASI